MSPPIFDPRSPVPGAGPTNKLVEHGYLDRTAHKAISPTEKLLVLISPENRKWLQGNRETDLTLPALDIDGQPYFVTVYMPTRRYTLSHYVIRCIKGPEGTDTFAAHNLTHALPPDPQDQEPPKNSLGAAARNDDGFHQKIDDRGPADPAAASRGGSNPRPLNPNPDRTREKFRMLRDRTGFHGPTNLKPDEKRRMTGQEDGKKKPATAPEEIRLIRTPFMSALVFQFLMIGLPMVITSYWSMAASWIIGTIMYFVSRKIYVSKLTHPNIFRRSDETPKKAGLGDWAVLRRRASRENSLQVLPILIFQMLAWMAYSQWLTDPGHGVQLFIVAGSALGSMVGFFAAYFYYRWTHAKARRTHGVVGTPLSDPPPPAGRGSDFLEVLSKVKNVYYIVSGSIDVMHSPWLSRIWWLGGNTGLEFIKKLFPNVQTIVASDRKRRSFFRWIDNVVSPGKKPKIEWLQQGLDHFDLQSASVDPETVAVLIRQPRHSQPGDDDVILSGRIYESVVPKMRVGDLLVINDEFLPQGKTSPEALGLKEIARQGVDWRERHDYPNGNRDMLPLITYEYFVGREINAWVVYRKVKDIAHEAYPIEKPAPAAPDRLRRFLGRFNAFLIRTGVYRILKLGVILFAIDLISSNKSPRIVLFLRAA